MSNAKKEPHLTKLTERNKRTGAETVWYIIRDGERKTRTGCTVEQTVEAYQKLAEYVQKQYRPTGTNCAAETSIAEVLFLYEQDKADGNSDPKAERARIKRLTEYMGDKLLTDIKGKLCRDYRLHRNTDSGARRDLQTLRAAISHYKAQNGLDMIPTITFPPKSLPRERAMTRNQAALLLLAARGFEVALDANKQPIMKHGYEIIKDYDTGISQRVPADVYTWKRRRDQKRSHLVRLILVGLYTGTRSGAILDLQWMANTMGGWVDLKAGIIHRKAEGERVAHNKRKTPVKMAPRLIAHMKRWKEADQGIRFAVHYNGDSPTKINKAFRSAIAACRLETWITPHVLRHTRGTWLAQSGVPSVQAAASLGLTVEEYERTYLHNDPSFQKEAANAY